MTEKMEDHGSSKIGGAKSRRPSRLYLAALDGGQADLTQKFCLTGLPEAFTGGARPFYTQMEFTEWC